MTITDIIKEQMIEHGGLVKARMSSSDYRSWLVTYTDGSKIGVVLGTLNGGYAAVLDDIEILHKAFPEAVLSAPRWLVR